MPRRWLPPATYFLALLPLVIASHVAATVAFALYDRLPAAVQTSFWLNYFLNGIAPGAAGVFCALALIALLTRWHVFRASWRGFALRTLPWFLVTSAIAYVVWQERTNGDFGLWGQLITWPLAALLAGVLTDAIVTWRRASGSPAA